MNKTKTETKKAKIRTTPSKPKKPQVRMTRKFRVLRTDGGWLLVRKERRLVSREHKKDRKIFKLRCVDTDGELPMYKTAHAAFVAGQAWCAKEVVPEAPTVVDRRIRRARRVREEIRDE